MVEPVASELFGCALLLGMQMLLTSLMLLLELHLLLLLVTKDERGVAHVLRHQHAISECMLHALLLLQSYTDSFTQLRCLVRESLLCDFDIQSGTYFWNTFQSNLLHDIFQAWIRIKSLQQSVAFSRARIRQAICRELDIVALTSLFHPHALYSLDNLVHLVVKGATLDRRSHKGGLRGRLEV